ncbi:MAG: MarR family transcriptional regulator [Arenimonas sp.]|nr:MarR family transcriptional regulator [Arenimonas sp.]MBP6309795.1 MarR family transcriptional regulator [Arenimonas sp.]
MKRNNIDSSARKIATTKAWLSVVRAYNLCDAALAARFSELGLRVGEHEVFANLVRSPGITQQELAHRCFVAKSGISMLITRMEAQKLLRRESDANDGRIKRLYLSAKGSALAAQTLAIQDEIVMRMMAPLSKNELDTLYELSTHVSERLQSVDEN